MNLSLYCVFSMGCVFPRRCVFALLGLAGSALLSGCQSTQATAAPKAAAITSAPAAASNSAGMSAKQQEYEQMLQEWKTLKPGLQRMLVIEEEMSQLIGQLALLAEATQNTAATSPAPAAVVPTVAPAASTAPATARASDADYVSAPQTPSKLAIAPAPAQAQAQAQETIALPAPAPTSASASASAADDKSSQPSETANYSLQVASLTELKLLPKKWQEMRHTHPQLLADLTPNFQAIKVNNTTYYRLKIGGFNTVQDANKKCSELLSAGISCLPAKYSESNFAQI